jgi:hypothetical protein
MISKRLAVALIAINIVLLILVVFPLRPGFAQGTAESVPNVIRAHSLEIIDDHGRTRAQILVAQPTVKDGVAYPDTVLFRLIDTDGQPSIKMAVSVEGSGFNVLGGPDNNGWYGLQVVANPRQNMIKLVNKEGREVIVQP